MVPCRSCGRDDAASILGCLRRRWRRGARWWGCRYCCDACSAGYGYSCWQCAVVSGNVDSRGWRSQAVGPVGKHVVTIIHGRQRCYEQDISGLMLQALWRNTHMQAQDPPFPLPPPPNRHRFRYNGNVIFAPISNLLMCCTFFLCTR